HVVQFSNGSGAAICRTPLAPPMPGDVYCALDVGPVDAGDVADVGPITRCDLGSLCTPPGAPDTSGSTAAPGAPGWLCCGEFGQSGPGGTTWQFTCQNPDGGRIPLFFPPPVDPDAGG